MNVNEEIALFSGKTANCRGCCCYASTIPCYKPYPNYSVWRNGSLSYIYDLKYAFTYNGINYYTGIPTRWRCHTPSGDNKGMDSHYGFIPYPARVYYKFAYIGKNSLNMGTDGIATYTVGYFDYVSNGKQLYQDYLYQPVKISSHDSGKSFYIYRKADNTTEKANITTEYSDWTDLGAKNIYLLSKDGRQLYGGKIEENSSIANNFKATKYGKLKNINMNQNCKILTCNNYVPAYNELNNSFSYKDDDSSHHGIQVVSGPFILDYARKARVTTTVNIYIMASTDPDWCWTGFGWKFTNKCFLGNLQVGSVDYYWRKGNYQPFEYYSDHPWSVPKNIGNMNVKNGFGGYLFNVHYTTGSHSYNICTTETIETIIPEGVSYLCLYFMDAASYGDSAAIKTIGPRIASIQLL